MQTSLQQRKFERTKLAAAIIFLISTQQANAIDFSQAPPVTVQPYVSPNVILSIDDSGSMAGENMGALKESLIDVISDTELLKDSKVRIGIQSMNNGGGWPGGNNVASGGSNTVRSLDSSHRGTILEFIDQTVAYGNTPSHPMFLNVLNYLRRTPTAGGPWSSSTSPEKFLGCRRNYHIFMTDGGWNDMISGSNVDAEPVNLPDGKRYTPWDHPIFFGQDGPNLADLALQGWATNLQPGLWNQSDEAKSILLDVDYADAPETEVINGQTIPKYWNPKYNPATWPNIVTYTIGYGVGATTWGTRSIQAPSRTAPYGFDGSFPDLLTGRMSWPDMFTSGEDRALDLWHAAINGRGRFYAVSKPADLKLAFQSIFKAINSQTSPLPSDVAVSNPSSYDTDVSVFLASFHPERAWAGWVEAQAIESSTNNTAAISPWGKDVTTATYLNGLTPSQLDQRLIYTYNSRSQSGTEFKWNSLDVVNINYLNQLGENNFDFLGSERVEYIRGKRIENKAFRERRSIHGDIVNSNIWYMGPPVNNYSVEGSPDFASKFKDRLPMIYVGANDGMLHGFSANDGKEKIAYIPKGVIKNLPFYTAPSFDENHRYYVDGPVFTGDLYLNQNPSINNWRSYLVGALGGGGRGYFILDVTDPSKNIAPDQFVIVDKTMPPQPSDDCNAANSADCEEQGDLGHIFSRPAINELNSKLSAQITRLNNGRWAAVMGNGYGSKNNRPVLLIQYLDGSKELLRIQTQDIAKSSSPSDARPADNGLSAPRLVDVNSNGIPDVAYAGDLQGNVWKFDLSSNNSNEWKVAFDGKPFFVALGPKSKSNASDRSRPQAITAVPSTQAFSKKDKDGNFVAGLMVAVTTGRNLTKADPFSTDVETVYGVIDNTRYVKRDGSNSLVKIHTGCSVPTGCGTNLPYAPKPQPITLKYNNGAWNLAKKAYDIPSGANQGKSTEDEEWKAEFWTSSEASEEIDWSKHDGWYLDLPSSGERVLENPSFYDNSNILSVFSIIPKQQDKDPTEESCKVLPPVSSTSYLTFINIIDGDAPKIPLLDTNADGVYDSTDGYASRVNLQRNVTDFVKGKAGSTLAANPISADSLPLMIQRNSWRQVR